MCQSTAVLFILITSLLKYHVYSHSWNYMYNEGYICGRWHYEQCIVWDPA